MGQDSLVRERIDAGAELVRLFHSFMPVEIAFWIKAEDDYRWTLCIASRKMDESMFDLAYGEALKLIQEMNNPNIDLFRIRLINSSNPRAAAALSARARHPGSRVATWLEEGWFGDAAIEGAYIYPESLTAEPNPASVN